MRLIQPRSDVGVAVELSVHVQPVHSDDSAGALLDEAASDWEEDPASF